MSTTVATEPTFPLCIFRPNVESVAQVQLRPGDVVVRGRLFTSTRLVTRYDFVAEAKGGYWMGLMPQDDIARRTVMRADLVTAATCLPCPTDWQQVCKPPTRVPPMACGGRTLIGTAEERWMIEPASSQGSESFAWYPTGVERMVALCGLDPHRVLRVQLSDAEVAANHEAERIIHAFPPLDEAVERVTANPGHAVVPIPRFHLP